MSVNVEDRKENVAEGIKSDSGLRHKTQNLETVCLIYEQETLSTNVLETGTVHCSNFAKARNFYSFEIANAAKKN